MRGRIEAVSGPTGRRHRPDGVKGRIVAQSCAGDVSASARARRHGIVGEDQVMQTPKRMAEALDRQNAGDPNYTPMTARPSTPPAI